MSNTYQPSVKCFWCCCCCSLGWGSGIVIGCSMCILIDDMHYCVIYFVVSTLLIWISMYHQYFNFISMILYLFIRHNPIATKYDITMIKLCQCYQCTDLTPFRHHLIWIVFDFSSLFTTLYTIFCVVYINTISKFHFNHIVSFQYIIVVCICEIMIIVQFINMHLLATVSKLFNYFINCIHSLLYILYTLYTLSTSSIITSFISFQF